VRRDHNWRPWLPWIAAVPAGVAARLSESYADVRLFGLVPVGVAALLVAGAAAALIARRGSRAGAFASLASGAAVLALAGLAVAAGAVEERADAARAAELAAAERDAADRPGWLGGASVDGATVVATGLDPTSDLVRLLGGGPARIPIVIAVDNRGATARVLDLSAATLTHAGGSQRKLDGGTRWPIPPASRLANALLFSAAPLDDAIAIAVELDGRPLVLRGRFLGVGEKRALRPR
jgi:hypothetical protein